jgi:hypothetical protein
MPNPDLYAFLTQQQAMEKQQKAAGGPAPSYAEEYGLAGAYTTGLEQEARLSQQHGEFEESMAFAEKQRQTQLLTSAASGAVSVPLAATQGYNLYERGKLASTQAANLAKTPTTPAPGTEATAAQPLGPSSTLPTATAAPAEAETAASVGSPEAAAVGEEAAGTAVGATAGGLTAGASGTAVGAGVGLGSAEIGAGAGAGIASDVGAGATVGSVWPGVGTIVGAAVGLVVAGVGAYFGSKKGKTVICTELLRQGLVSPEVLAKVHSYQWDWEIYWGYRTWADKVVKGMQKSRFLTRLVLLIAKPYMKEILHQLDPNQLGSFCGVLLIRLGVPLCRQIFRFNVRRYRKALAWQQDCFKKVGE